MDSEQELTQELRTDSHYVPSTYLKRWARDGKLWTYRLLVPHANYPPWRPYSLSAIPKHRHLYTRVAAAGETDEFERWLDSDFESPANSVLDQAVTDGRLSRHDWRILARFVAAQDLRTPTRLWSLMQRLATNLPETLQDTVERSVRELEAAIKDGRRLRRPELADATGFPARVTIERSPQAGGGGQLRVEAVAGRAMWLFHIRHSLTSIVHVLERHRWTIWRAPRGRLWLTSDDPVIRLNYHSPERYDFNGGWGSVGTEILMPLGPSHLLYTKIGSASTPRGTRMSQGLFELTQRFIIEHAHRFVFAAAPDAQAVDIRPRLVDATAFRAEREQWGRFHQEQSQAERGIFPEAPSAD